MAGKPTKNAIKDWSLNSHGRIVGRICIDQENVGDAGTYITTSRVEAISKDARSGIRYAVTQNSVYILLD